MERFAAFSIDEKIRSMFSTTRFEFNLLRRFLFLAHDAFEQKMYRIKTLVDFFD